MEYGYVFGWLVLLGALSLLGRPLAARLFPEWPTRGVGFALPITLLTVGVVAFWVGRVTFGPLVVLAGLAVVAGAGIALSGGRKLLRGGRPSGDDLRSLVVPEWNDRVAVAETAVVFLAAFGFLVAVRAADPGIFPYAGEKFLDYGLVRTLLRADTLPPEDMWFAGESVRYYYGGHLLTAVLTMLAGTPPAIAYNLALAAFFAMYVTAAFDLAGAIAAARGYARRPAAWGAAFFVAVGSNLQTAGVIALQNGPGWLRTTVLNSLPGPIAQQVSSRLNGSFSYWSASRVIPGTINEFPLFAFLNGDLHAHMTDTPFLLLGAAVAFAIFRADDPGRRRLLLFGVVPVIAGFQAVINTWSFPTVFGVAWLAVAMGPASPRELFPRGLRTRIGRAVAGDPVTDGGRDRLWTELSRPMVAAGAVGVAGMVGLVIAVPFLMTAAGSGSEREIALLAASNRSSYGGLLVVHGGFLALFVAYLFDRFGRRGPAELLAAFGVLVVAAQVVSLPALVVVGGVLLAGWIAVRTQQAGFATVLVVGGAGLVLLVEVVYLNEQAGPGRFNTVFKTYAQVWALWAPAAGVAIAGLLRRVETPAVWPTRSTRQAVAVVLVVLVVASSGAYATKAVPQQFTAGSDSPSTAYSFGYPAEPTLNGTAYVEQFHPEAAPVIRYLDRVSGQPTLLSAPATGRYPGDQPANSQPVRMYGFQSVGGTTTFAWASNPAASLTGVPTVAGWHHEVGYRGSEAYLGRVRAVDEAYTNRTAAIQLLVDHDVTYVSVGYAERARYSGELIDFGAIPGVEAVVTTDGTTLYRVDHSELPTA